MNLANSQLFCPIFFFLIIALFSETVLRTLGQQIDWENDGSQNRFGHRVLMSFKEKPRGSNVTFECSPSGPCVPCLYSEKGDEKYRCSETGYRIPLKCMESEDSVKSSKKTDSQNAQSTLDSSSTSGNGSQAYITYRSCIPSTTEDKLSVLRFEVRSSSVHVGGFKQWLLDSFASIDTAAGAYLCWALYCKSFLLDPNPIDYFGESYYDNSMGMLIILLYGRCFRDCNLWYTRSSGNIFACVVSEFTHIPPFTFVLALIFRTENLQRRRRANEKHMASRKRCLGSDEEEREIEKKKIT